MYVLHEYYSCKTYNYKERASQRTNYMISVEVGWSKVKPQETSILLMKKCKAAPLSNEIYSTCVELKCIMGERRKKMHG